MKKTVRPLTEEELKAVSGGCNRCGCGRRHPDRG